MYVKIIIVVRVVVVVVASYISLKLVTIRDTQGALLASSIFSARYAELCATCRRNTRVNPFSRMQLHFKVTWEYNFYFFKHKSICLVTIKPFCSVIFCNDLYVYKQIKLLLGGWLCLPLFTFRKNFSSCIFPAMPTKCIAAGCSKTTKDGVSLHGWSDSQEQ